jgi:hypothetical protein
VDAVVLLGDGRLRFAGEVPALFGVVDESRPLGGDTRVERMQHIGRRVFATVVGEMGEISAGGALVGSGRVEGRGLVAGRVPGNGAVQVDGRAGGGDLWPENDGLGLVMPAAEVGGRMELGEAELRSVGDVAAAAVVSVGRRVSAGEVEILKQFVRDLGGTLVVNHVGMEWEAGQGWLPVSVRLPGDPGRWWVLVDASGSMEPHMAEVARAVKRLWTQLPVGDEVTVGSFGAGLRVWGAGKVGERAVAVPKDLLASGPTNLRGVLGELPAQPSATNLVLITDGSANVGDADLLTEYLRQSQYTLHVWMMGDGGAGALDELARATGGGVTLGGVDGLERLAAAAIEGGSTRPVDMVWEDGSGGRQAMALPVYAREGAQVLARASGGAGDGGVVAAKWRVGLGEVIASATALLPDEKARVTKAARAMDQGRYVVSVENNRRAKVIVHDRGETPDAPVLQIAGERVEMRAVEPRHYEAELPSSNRERAGVIEVAGKTIARVVIARRYDGEFDEIGVSEGLMTQVAAATGGAVAVLGDEASERGWKQKLAGSGRPVRIELAPWLAGAAAAAGLSGLLMLLWHRSGGRQIGRGDFGRRG